MRVGCAVLFNRPTPPIVSRPAPATPRLATQTPLRVVLLGRSPLAMQAGGMLTDAGMQARMAADAKEAGRLLAGGGWDALLAECAPDPLPAVERARGRGWTGPVVLLAE